VAECGGEASKQLDSVKHLLSHGNVEEALQRLGNLFLDLDLIQKRSARRRSWRPAWRNSRPIFETTRSPSRTTESALGKGKRDQRGVCRTDDQPGGKPEIRQGAVRPTCYSKPARKSWMTNSKQRFGDGTRCSELKRRQC